MLAIDSGGVRHERVFPLPLAALNWLTHASVEGSDGLDAQYIPTSGQEGADMVATLTSYSWADADDSARYSGSFGVPDLKLKDALKYLAIKLKEKDKKSTEVRTETVGGETWKYLPPDKVYDHGFYPLEGGFKATSSEPFAVFDQWVEVLPTDQMVAVQVKYDPVTGLLIV